jgi:hypothetical protein
MRRLTRIIRLPGMLAGLIILASLCGACLMLFWEIHRG